MALEEIHRLDGFSNDAIKNVLKFVLEDEFWQAQIRSLAGLRKRSSRNNERKFENAYADYKKSIPQASEVHYELVMEVTQDDC